MKTPSLLEGILFALISSLVVSIIYFALSSLFSDSIMIRLLISMLSLGYILYLLSRSNQSTGRITVITTGGVLVITLWFFQPSITLFILLHLMTIWLVRSLYFYSSLVSSLADLALNGLSLITAFWAANHTNSLFLTVWCFFLIQALFVFIPTRINKPSSEDSIIVNIDDDFQRAFHAAEAAIKQLSTNP